MEGGTQARRGRGLYATTVSGRASQRRWELALCIMLAWLSIHQSGKIAMPMHEQLRLCSGLSLERVLQDFQRPPLNSSWTHLTRKRRHLGQDSLSFECCGFPCAGRLDIEPEMETSRGIEAKKFYQMLITLACQTWTLSRLFQRVPFPSITLRESLVSFENRMKRISSFLLIDYSITQPDFKEWASLHNRKVYSLSEYSLATTALAEIFSLFTPAFALCFVLNDYNGTGGTGRKKDFRHWFAGDHHSMEKTPADDVMSQIFLGVAAECEARTLGVLQRFDFFAVRILHFYPNLLVVLLSNCP